MKIYEDLCYYDKRNPEYVGEDEPERKSKKCFCDNCFYGRDRLANEIISLQKGKIVVLIEGGVCQAIHATNPKLEVVLFDRDDQAEEDKVIVRVTKDVIKVRHYGEEIQGLAEVL